MKVRVGDILKNFDKLRQETNLFKNKSERLLINNLKASTIQPTVRTGNFWRAEISEQANLETTGSEIICVMAANPYVKTINAPDKFIADWTSFALEYAATPRCVSVIDNFHRRDFLKPKLYNVMNNKLFVFNSLKRLPRKIILEMAKTLLDFDSHYKIQTKSGSYMDACEIIFQHGFVFDSDPQKVIIREYWNSTHDAEGMARVIKTLNESEFTGRAERFSF